MAETIKIGGELESMATGGVVAAASAIKDKAKDKYQSEVNQEVSQALADRYTKDNVYSKEQTDAKIEAQIVDVTTREKYATFSATNEDVSIDTILPDPGLEDTIYRVANWDGTEYNTSYWSQYAWVQDTEDTGHYVLLAIKNQGLDTTPTPNSLNPVSSGGVADSCGYLVDCPEFMKVETDANGRIIHSVSKEDGAYYFHKLKSPTLDSMMEDMQTIKEEAEEEVRQSIEDSQEELAAHYDYYNVSKHHSVRDTVNIYTVNEGWEEIEYNASLGQYDELDIYQIGEQCNYGGNTEHSYQTTIAQRGVAPAIITQEYVTRTKFTLEEALAVLPEAVISAFAAGQKICFVDLDDFVEEWQITESGTWEKISPYDINDPEGRLEVKTDAYGKIVAYRKTDGTWVECVGIEAPNLGDYVEKEEGKSLIDAEVSESNYTIDDPEGRHEMVIDKDNKIVSYRKHDGTLVEEVGLETPCIHVNELDFTEHGIEKIQQDLINAGFSPQTIKVREFKMPNYGLVNIKTEIFYLTADSRYSQLSQLELVQMLEDTNANAKLVVPLYRYYIPSSITDGDAVPLMFYSEKFVKENDGRYYAKDRVTRLGNKYYYSDTLKHDHLGRYMPSSAVIDGYSLEYPTVVSGMADGETKTVDGGEVYRFENAVNFGLWAVHKEPEHHCIVDFDFGHYLTKNNVHVGVKYQGASTQDYRKRNFRFTFYKNSTPLYSKDPKPKKDKKKFGEMLRLSGYNLKANWLDELLVKEHMLYRVFLTVWENRDVYDRFPWYKTSNPYCGANGLINGFPIRVSINGDFWGEFVFGLKKDESNYMISGDTDEEVDANGMFVCGDGNTTDCWTLPKISTWFGDEIFDELTDSNIITLDTFGDFINNRLYNAEDGREYGLSQCGFYAANSSNYTSAQVTKVDDTFYVTSTLTYDSVTGEYSVNENSVAIISVYPKDWYWDNEHNIYPRSEMEKVNGVHYVRNTLTEIEDPETHEISYEVNENSVVIEHFNINTNSLVPFDKDNIPDRMSVIDWIDYFIGMQVFLMIDNTHNNLILYSDSEKKKMYPFFYDLDNSLNLSNPSITYDADILAPGVALSNVDVSLWNNFIELYWDEIVNRYCELRRTVLTTEYIESLYNAIVDNIPDEDYADENTKWDRNTSKNLFYNIYKPFIESRFQWLDEYYFKI